MEPLTDELAHEDPVDECHAQALGGSTKDLSLLSDIYWVNIFLLACLYV